MRERIDSVCCSVLLQGAAVCNSVLLQSVAVCNSVLQRVAASRAT